MRHLFPRENCGSVSRSAGSRSPRLHPPKETREHSVKGFMPSGTGDRPLDGSSLCYSVNEVHSWEEECSSRPALSPRPGPSVSFSRGVRRDLQGFRSPPHGLVLYSGKCQVAFLHVSSSGPHGLEAGCLSSSLGRSPRLRLSPVYPTSLSIVLCQTFGVVLLGSDRPFVASKRVIR